MLIGDQQSSQYYLFVPSCVLHEIAKAYKNITAYLHVKFSYIKKLLCLSIFKPKKKLEVIVYPIKNVHFLNMAFLMSLSIAEEITKTNLQLKSPWKFLLDFLEEAVFFFISMAFFKIFLVKQLKKHWSVENLFKI